MSTKPAAKSTSRKTGKKHKTTAKHKESAAAKAHAKHEAHIKHEQHLHHLHEEHEAHLARLGKKAPKALAIGDALPVCAFEAIAASLRLAGQRVHEDDVVELWHLSGAGADGASVGEALAAAARFGLAGCRPRTAELVVAATPVGAFPLIPLDLESASMDRPVAVVGGAELDPVATSAACEHPLNGQPGFACVPAGALLRECLTGHALILGVDVPAPHAVLATADGWWSWGELLAPWPARVDEAWAVSWA